MAPTMRATARLIARRSLPVPLRTPAVAAASPTSRGFSSSSAAPKQTDGAADTIDSTSLAQLRRLRDVMKGRGKFEDLGIGGLDALLNRVFKRTFASRMLPPAHVERLKLVHTKGILIHGPPGTGKTLTARQIGVILGARTPKHINGPEIFSSLVGQSEETIRKIFEASEREWRMKGNKSPLHVIVFDEIDAVCKRRDDVNTSGRSRVHDNVVNQLLTKIDGLTTQNNLLVIGVTNRKDLLDEALLRPGRLEVHIEIPLPDQEGRRQILEIHTRELREAGMIQVCGDEEDDEEEGIGGGGGVDLDAIAAMTRGFTGAELEGLVRSAIAFALADHQEALATLAEREVKSQDGEGAGKDRDVDESTADADFLEFLENQGATSVGSRHFREALQSVERSADILDAQHRADVAAGRIVDRAGHAEYDHAVRLVDGMAAATAAAGGLGDTGRAVDEDVTSATGTGGETRPATRSVLLTGRNGAGRMTAVSEIVDKHVFENVQRLDAHTLVGKPDAERIFVDAFADAARADRSVLILDDLDLMIQLEPRIGAQLATLLRTPLRNTSMLVIATAAGDEVAGENGPLVGAPSNADSLSGHEGSFGSVVRFPAPRREDLAAFATVSGWMEEGADAFAEALRPGSTFQDARLVLEQVAAEAGGGSGSSEDGRESAVAFWDSALSPPGSRPRKEFNSSDYIL